MGNSDSKAGKVLGKTRNDDGPRMLTPIEVDDLRRDKRESLDELRRLRLERLKARLGTPGA